MPAADEHEEEDEEAVLQRALMMSLPKEQQANVTPAPNQQQEFKDLLQDNAFLQDIAKDLGIDNIDNILGGGSTDQAKKDEEAKKKEEDKK